MSAFKKRHSAPSEAQDVAEEAYPTKDAAAGVTTPETPQAEPPVDNLTSKSAEPTSLTDQEVTPPDDTSKTEPPAVGEKGSIEKVIRVSKLGEKVKTVAKRGVEFFFAELVSNLIRAGGEPKSFTTYIVCGFPALPDYNAISSKLSEMGRSFNNLTSYTSGEMKDVFHTGEMKHPLYSGGTNSDHFLSCYANGQPLVVYTPKSEPDIDWRDPNFQIIRKHAHVILQAPPMLEILTRLDAFRRSEHQAAGQDAAPFDDDGLTEALAELGASGREITPQTGRAVFAVLERAEEKQWRVTANDLEILKSLPDFKIALPGTGRISAGAFKSVDTIPGLAPKLRARLRDLVQRLRDPDEPPIGVIFDGPPGTGKTMMSKIIAHKSGRNYVEFSLADAQKGDYKNVISSLFKAFDEAKKVQPSILFIDEVDGFGARNTNENGGAYTSGIINAFLECMDGVEARGDVAVLSATNRREIIDPAIRRPGRLGEAIFVGYPDLAGRREILHTYMPDLSHLEVADLALRVGHCSPAALRGISDEANGIAKRQKRQVRMGDVEVAIASAVERLLAGRSLEAMLPAVAVGVAAEALMLHIIYDAGVEISGLSVRPGPANLGRVIYEHHRRDDSGTVMQSLRGLHVALAPIAARGLAAEHITQSGDLAGMNFLINSENDQDKCNYLAKTLLDMGYPSGYGKIAGRWHPDEERICATELKLVRKVLAAHLPLLLEISTALLRHGELASPAFYRMIDADVPQQQWLQ